MLNYFSQAKDSNQQHNFNPDVLCQLTLKYDRLSTPILPLVNRNNLDSIDRQSERNRTSSY